MRVSIATINNVSFASSVKVGIDFGDNKTMVLLPGSLTPSVVDIDNGTNILGMKKKHKKFVKRTYIFRVDTPTAANQAQPKKS